MLLLATLLLVSSPPDEQIRDRDLAVTFVWAKESRTATSQGQRLVCGAPYKEEVEAAMPRIRAIFADYGRDVLAKVQLKGARLCRDLVWRFDKPQTRIIDGARDVRTEQAVGGLAVYSESRIYVDVAASLRARRIAETFHHEIFHFVERVIADGAFGQSWDQTNPAGFRYAGTGFDAMGTSPLLPGEHAGFVSAYARASALEDRAELFTWWRTRPGELTVLVQKDRVLGQKLALLAAQLNERLPDLGRRLPAISRR